MNIKLKRFIFIFAICTSFFANNISSNNSGIKDKSNSDTINLYSTDKLISEAAGLIDQKIICAISQTKKIDVLLEDLLQLIENGSVKLEAKTDVLAKIKSIRQEINKIITAPFEQADLHAINFILDINNHLIKKLNYTIQKDLSKIKDIIVFDQEILKKSVSNYYISQENIPENLQDQKQDPYKLLEEYITNSDNKFMQNEADYNRLEKNIQNVGLSGINLAYRNFIIKPVKIAQKYNLFTIVKWSLFASAAIVYSLYRFTPFLEKYLGKAPQEIQYPLITPIAKIETPESQSWFSKFEKNIYSTMQMPLAKILIAAAPALFYNDLTDLWAWVQNNAKNIHYKLAGGQKEKNINQFKLNAPRYTFDDVVGADHIKNELNLLIEYLKNSERFSRLGIGIQSGILFAGPPGTGKSLIAEAFAGQIEKELKNFGAENKINFISVEASEIYEIILSNGVNAGINGFLNYAKKHAPCIVFIDEPDLLGLQRTANKDLLSKFLNIMNGFMSSSASDNIILIAATNRPDNLDPALLRQGRFGKIIYFDYPDLQARTDYIEKILNPIVTNIQEFNIQKLAIETEGCTFEAIKSFIRKAFQCAKIAGYRLTQKNLEDALNSEIRQILPASKTINHSELEMTAASIAAQAISSIMLQSDQELLCATINPVMGSVKESSVWDRYYKDQEKIITQGKIFTSKADQTREFSSKQELLNRCKIMFSGQVGQEILLGKSNFGFNKTYSEKILSIALTIALDGLNLDSLPKKLTAKYYDIALSIIESCKFEIKELLAKEKAKLELLQKALLEHKTLCAAQIMDIIKNK